MDGPPGAAEAPPALPEAPAAAFVGGGGGGGGGFAAPEDAPEEALGVYGVIDGLVGVLRSQVVCQSYEGNGTFAGPAGEDEARSFDDSSALDALALVEQIQELGAARLVDFEDQLRACFGIPDNPLDPTGADGLDALLDSDEYPAFLNGSLYGDLGVEGLGLGDLLLRGGANSTVAREAAECVCDVVEEMAEPVEVVDGEAPDVVVPPLLPAGTDVAPPPLFPGGTAVVAPPAGEGPPYADLYAGNGTVGGAPGTNLTALGEGSPPPPEDPSVAVWWLPVVVVASIVLFSLVPGGFLFVWYRRRRSRALEAAGGAGRDGAGGDLRPTGPGDVPDFADDKARDDRVPHPVPASWSSAGSGGSSHSVELDSAQILAPFVSAEAMGRRIAALSSGAIDEGPPGELALPEAMPVFQANDFDVKDLKFLAVIGRGAFGVVYRGRYKGQLVAIKVSSLAFHEAKEHYQSFIREVEILSRLQHPHVVQLYAASLNPPHICIVEELVPKGSLHDALYKHGWEPSPLQILQIVADIAGALAYLHPQIVHCDLKPQNVLLDEDDRAKVADFGVSKYKSGTYIMGQSTNTINGTPGYMAPELFSAGKVSEKCDVYSLGVLAWVCYCKTEPWASFNFPMQVVMAVAVEKKRPAIPDAMPKPLRSLISKCWEEEPHRRPSCAEIQKRALIEMQELKGSASARSNASEGAGGSAASSAAFS